MKKLATCLVMLWTTSSLAWAQDASWQKVTGAKELVIGFCAQYPPFESRNEKTKELEGFDVALGFSVGILRFRSPFFFSLFSPYVEVVRGTPLLIQLFFIYYALPSIGITLGCFSAGILGLGLNSGAYISEIVRGALYGMGKGQQEAAMGLTWLQTMGLVVVPQAIRTAIPPLVNAFSSTIKDACLVSIIAVTELTRASQLVYTRTFRAFEIYLTVGLLYFGIILLVSALFRRLEARFAPGMR